LTSMRAMSPAVGRHDTNLTFISPSCYFQMFGFPSGLGALLCRRDALAVLVEGKTYFGGGTVAMHLVKDFSVCHLKAGDFAEEALEDGTLPFQQIMALEHCFNAMNELIPGGMDTVSEHTFALARDLYLRLKELKHSNGHPLAELYSGPFEDRQKQGAVVTFNLLKSNGQHYGFNAFRRVADEEQIVSRVGCFCNVGACSEALKLTDEELAKNFAAGHVCGDDVDVLRGRPVGAIRLSFGWHNEKEDVDKVICLLEGAFLKDARKVDQHDDDSVRVHRIFVYPVKSAAALTPEEWTADAAGFEYDRWWAVADSNGRVLGQKRLRGLCLLKPHLDLESGTLSLSYPGMPTKVKVPIQQSSKTSISESCMGNVCGRKEEISDCGEEVAAWLSEALGEEGLRLVRKSSIGALTLANSAPYLVINRASVNEMYDSISSEPDEDWLLGQFRANLVLDGGEKAFAEDNWLTGHFNGAKLVRQSACGRCHVVSFDQENGGDANEVKKALTYMTERGFKFGVLFKFEGGPVRVKVGDEWTMQSGLVNE